MSTISCECCWIATVDVSISDPERFCTTCRAHKFSLDNARRDHCVLVQRLVADQAAAAASLQQEIDLQAATIKQLDSEISEFVNAEGLSLADMPHGILERVSNAAINEMRDRARRAYRARDRAMAAVWLIDERHHENSRDKCSCGLPLRACKDYRTLDFIRESYEQWERKQIQLMKNGREHGLPRNHPEARKLNVEEWRWLGAPSTEREELGRRRYR